MKNSTIEQAAEGIQRRVAELAGKFTQSELSRRTGAAVSNVNRYMNGTRVPADFCSALVQHLGVNPAWLLSGEGAPYLSDVSDQTSHMAGDMLELVEALNAVTRMRVGSLAGKHHLRVLRELNDALTTYRGLRDKLNQRSGPILDQITADMVKASDRHQIDQAADLRQAGEQIADFCQDRERLRSFHAAAATVEYMSGRPDRALEITRDVFARTLTGTDRLSGNAITQAHNLVAALCQFYRLDEAQRVGRAAIALAGTQLEGLGAHQELRTLAGIVEVELGNLSEGLSLIAASFPRTSENYRLQSVGPVARAFLLCGFMTFEEMEGRKDLGHGKLRHLVRFAIWEESTARLEHTLKTHLDVAATHQGRLSMEAVHARLLLAALRKPKPAALKAGLAELAAVEVPGTPRAVIDVIRCAYGAQLAHVHGDPTRSLELVREAEAELVALGPDVRPDMLLLAMLRRNAVRAIPAGAQGELGALRDHSAAFIAEHLSRGYNFLLHK